MAARQGQFVWFDLMTSDPARARAFYSELFGWRFVPFDGASDYEMFVASERPIGGIVAIPEALSAEGVPSHWFAHALVDDVDARVELARSLGAEVKKPPTDIPNVGRHAVILDPQGAPLSLYKGAGEVHAPRAGETPVPGEPCWHELMTTDPDGALAFYGQVLGFTQGETLEMPEGTYQICTLSDGERVAGIMKLPAEAEAGGVPSHWLHYTVVEDVDASLERALALGGERVHGPVDTPGGRIAIVKDPTGAVFAMWPTPSQA